jgi:uncharacterized protein
LLDNPENLDVLNKHEIGVGVSIDGNRQTNDEHRKYRNGRGSFNNVVRGADRLRATHPLLFRAILCTVSLDADPIETYEAILEFSPPSIDLLLPHGNWDNPPPGREADSAATPYADWMLAIHDRQQRDRAARVSRTAAHIPPIRFLSAIQGGALVETIGLAKTTLIVVETDGSIEQVDTLKSAYQGAAETGLNVREHSFDQAMEHPGVQARRTGATALSATCQQCPILSDCGGGYYPHRYGQGSFQNPSVFCKDLLKIVRTVRGGA